MLGLDWTAIAWALFGLAWFVAQWIWARRLVRQVETNRVDVAFLRSRIDTLHADLSEEIDDLQADIRHWRPTPDPGHPNG